ncbi:hypothetical protein [Fulvivirga sp.]|uniref:hypothetical protein n=1 Tax=Fulvivirga sp. TaxID=1931237 RepID=UPI0032EDD11A
MLKFLLPELYSNVVLGLASATEVVEAAEVLQTEEISSIANNFLTANNVWMMLCTALVPFH